MSLSVEEVRKGAAYREQGDNESAADYSRDMLLLLAKDDIPEHKQVDLYVANMTKKVSESVGVKQPKNLTKTKKYAIECETMYNMKDEVQINALGMIDRARDILDKNGINTSSMYIADKHDGNSRGR